MSEKRSGQDKRSGVNHPLFFDRRSGKDRRSTSGTTKKNLIFRKRSTDKEKQKAVLDSQLQN
jgi:hypothetical protein